LGTDRPNRQHHIAGVGCGIPHTNVDRGQVEAIFLSTVRHYRTIRARYSKSSYHPGGSPVIEKAVQEHGEQQITFRSAGVFSSITRRCCCGGMVRPSSAQRRGIGQQARP